MNNTTSRQESHAMKFIRKGIDFFCQKEFKVKTHTHAHTHTSSFISLYKNNIAKTILFVTEKFMISD